MSTLLKKLRFVDETYATITFGYIRKMESELLSTQFQIPLEIKTLCLLYGIEYEQFDKYKHSKHLQISSSDDHKQNNVVQQIYDGCWYSVYGRAIIDPVEYPLAIYEWIFKFTRQDGKVGTSPSIGIISITKDDKYPLDAYCFNNIISNIANKYTFYAWQTGWANTRSTQKIQDAGYGRYAGLDRPEMIKMQLDINKRTLRFYRSDQDLGIAFTNIDMNKKYRLAISFANITHEIQLMHFSNFGFVEDTVIFEKKKEVPQFVSYKLEKVW